VSAVKLLASAPVLKPSEALYALLNKERSYRGAPRRQCGDTEWGYILAAVKFLSGRVPKDDPYTEIPRLLAEALVGLKGSRPVEQLISEFYDATDDAGMIWDWWCQHKDREPTEDFSRVLTIAFASNWDAMSQSPTTPAGRYTPTVPDLTEPLPKYLIKGLLFEGQLGVLYSKYGAGKSAAAVEMCADVARGTPYHGHKTRKGVVVYVPCESPHGFRARLAALLKERGLTMDDFDGNFCEIKSRPAPHLLKPEEVQELITDLKPLGPIALIVIDTYARATAGAEENSSKDAGIAVHNCQQLQEQTGACVLLLHHTGKNEALGMRGSSALPGGIDTEIYIERPDEEANFRNVKVGKQRDLDDHTHLFSFELKKVQLGVDEDGDPITSVVVQEVDQKPKNEKESELLPNTPVRRAIRVVVGNAMRPMPFEEMIAAAKEKLAPPDPGKEDRRRDRIKATYERMLLDHELHVDADKLVTLMSPASPFPPVPAANDTDPNADLAGEQGGVS
jgi:hypothetical protein